MTNFSPTRRAALQLPSRRKHVLLAGVTLLLGLALPILALTVFGDPADAQASGKVAVAALPATPALSPLANETLDTPDLLAGEVPDGANPTEGLIDPTEPKTDALGNPVSKAEPKIVQVDPSLPSSRPQALTPAPIAGLTREGTFGPIPQRGAQTALDAYKRPFRAQSGRKPVSIIIGGLGINRGLTQLAIDTLPADVTLSFAAHSIGLQEWVDTARRDGHEVLIEIPMESDGFNPAEPGADRALRVDASDNENARNLDWILSRAQGYAGVINFNGDLFLRRTDAAGTFVNALSNTGLGFITDGAFDTPSLPVLAESVSQPFETGHGLIDPDPIPLVIRGRLSSLADSAQSGDHPVGVGFGFPETLAETMAWIEMLDNQNLQLAPATAALD